MASLRRNQRAVILLFAGGLAAGMPGCAPRQQQVTGQSWDQAAVEEDKEYENNQYVPGLGYFHAFHRGFFPMPFNHHVANQGFYSGGSWFTAPQQASVTRSRPSAEAVNAIRARNASLPRLQSPTSQRSSNSFRAGGFGVHGSTVS